MIDQRETEVLAWAIKIADAKDRAEAAKAAGNNASFQLHAGEAEAARQKLRSLGYPWVADQLSADGATATQTRLYVQSLRAHLDRYDGTTPALTLQAALSSSPSGGLGWFGSTLSAASTATRAETVNWLQVVQLGIKIVLPVVLVWGFVKSFRIKAHVGR